MQKPRQTPIADRVHEVAVWYHAQTGLGTERYANGRILAIMLYLERHGLDPADCRMEVVSDPLWQTRGNRTDAEGLAELVGRTQTSGKRPQYWFIMPAKPARKAASA